MGTITESFAGLAEFLQAAQRQPAQASARRSAGQLLIDQFLRPWLPQNFRLTPGAVFDAHDHTVGPFDVVAAADTCPPVGEGRALSYPAEGVLFALDVRDWMTDDLSAFGLLASAIKKLQRRREAPVFCAAVTLNALPLSELTEFLSGPEGSAIDAVLSVGRHLWVRNAAGLYGDAGHLPWVSEQGAGPSLKAFAFLLLKLATSFSKTPFELTDYQHL